MQKEKLLNIPDVSGSLFLEKVFKEIDTFTKDYLCDLSDPDSGDREIQTGFEHFKGWLKDKYTDH